MSVGTPIPNSKFSQQVKNETVRLKYIQWSNRFNTEKPYEIISQVPSDFPPSNFSLDYGPGETIHDIRGKEQRFNLDDHGFEVQRHTLSMVPFDKQAIEQEYLPSIISHLKNVLGSEAEVQIFDWRLRSSDQVKSKLVPGAKIDLNDRLTYHQPVHAVHVDQSPNGAIKRVRHHMEDRAEELLKRRFRIVNVWRPLHHSIENYPLAVCDGSSVPAEMLVAVDHVRKFYVGESLYPLACPEYRWYFLNQQTVDEVLLVKTYDSAEEAPARCCPHTSFVQSGVALDAKPRETIEVRALVFTEH